MSVTATEATREIARRKAPKGSAKRKKYPRQEIMDLGTADLRTLAGVKSEPKPKAKATPRATTGAGAKPGRPKGNNPHTILRAAATAVGRAAYHEGNKMSYQAQCDMFGTNPAKAGLDESTKVTPAMLDEAKAALADPAAFLALV